MSSIRRIESWRIQSDVTPPGHNPASRACLLQACSTLPLTGSGSHFFAGAKPACLVAGLLCLAATAPAQESIRMSLAGAEAAAARRSAAESLGYYNLKLGPTGWRFGAGLGVEVTDNVNLTQNGAASDVILSPQANTRMLWPVTEQNSLNLALGAGYSAYTLNPGLSRAFITPGSELAFDLYVGDFWFNFHDRFSISENAAQDPTVAGSGDYSQLQNAVGVSGLWDLNKVLVKAGYDHENFESLSGPVQAQDGQAEVFSTSSGYRLRPELLAGLEAGGSLLTFSQTGTNSLAPSAVQWNVGAFADYQLSEYIHLDGHVGYTEYVPSEGGAPGTQSTLRGAYGQVDLSHRLNQYITYTLSGGRTVTSGFFGGSVDLEFVRWQANWRLLRQVDLGTSFTYEHGTQFAFGSETFDRYGPGFTLGRGITQKLSASLTYQFYWRTSDLEGRDYTVNTVMLNLSYQF